MRGSPAARSRVFRTWWFIPASFILLIAAAAPTRAADDESDAAQTNAPGPAQSRADFLFGRPRGWVSLNGTWLFPRADGDLFAFVSDHLTVDRSDFRAAAFSGAVGVSLTPELDIVGDIEASRRGVASEYRRYVKPDRSPIAQTTRLNQTALAFGVRYSPFGRGREISNYAFLPRRVTPYVGAGASLVYYEFSQTGQFVDFVDLSIFDHVFRSKGWSVGPHLNAGADVQIWRALFLNAAVRYVWAHPTLGKDFVGFDGIDLAGFRSSTGITVVF